MKPQSGKVRRILAATGVAVGCCIGGIAPGVALADDVHVLA